MTIICAALLRTCALLGYYYNLCAINADYALNIFIHNGTQEHRLLNMRKKEEERGGNVSSGPSSLVGQAMPLLLPEPSKPVHQIT